MKPKRRMVGFLLALCLVAGLLPTAAFAEGTDTGKAIQLVDSGTAANISGGQADSVYFGNYQQSSLGNTEPTEGVEALTGSKAKQPHATIRALIII